VFSLVYGLQRDASKGLSGAPCWPRAAGGERRGPGAPIAHVGFLRNAAGPETEPAASAPALKETDGGRTKPDQFSSPQPTTVSNKTGAGVH